MAETFTRIGFLPTNCLSHIIKKIRNPRMIVEVDAWRAYQKEPPKKSKDKIFIEKLPFITLRETLWKSLMMRFRGRHRVLVKHEYGSFPLEDIRKVLREKEIEDMAVSHFVLLCDNIDLWETYKNQSKTMSFDKKEQTLILSFSSNKSITKNPYVLREVNAVMKNQVDDLGFKASTLDLKKIETYPDWKMGAKNNLLVPNMTKREMKFIMYSVFKEPDGKIDKIHVCDRTSRLTDAKTWELIEVGKL